MDISGKQAEQLYEALLDAYPTRGGLERMVAFRLGVNLNAIVGEGSLQTVVFHLIEWAIANGRLAQLVEGAWEINASNPRLNKFMEAYRQGFATPGQSSPSNSNRTTPPIDPSLNPSLASWGSAVSAPLAGVPSNSVSVTNAPSQSNRGNSRRVWRVVVASPGDVPGERDVLGDVIAELNRTIAPSQGKVIDLVRWETDAVPGFSNRGPQGVIDPILRIEDADILIGIFWKRFGTPVQDAGSGTEHEFLTAYRSWQEKGHPQLLIYFNQKAYLPQSVEELEQYRQVLEFKKRFPAEGLYWTYNGKAQFEKLVRNHLTQCLIQTPPLDISSQVSDQGGNASLSQPLANTQQTQTSNDRAFPSVSAQHRARVFISYRHVAEDQALAQALFRALRPHHEVFLDTVIPIGTDWAARIQRELEQADFFIVLLSEDSVNSEMVGGEITTAHRRRQEFGRPQILPVRVRNKQPLRYPLNSYLDPIQWVVWNGPEDTAGLVSSLLSAMQGGTLPGHPVIEAEPQNNQPHSNESSPSPFPQAQPVVLAMPEGSMDASSHNYIERNADRVALAAIRTTGMTITIKGPRQMGKSSLLNRVIQTALHADKRIAFLDFQLFGYDTLQNPDIFYQQFCHEISDQLNIEDQVEMFWKQPLSNNHRCTRYFGKHLLPKLNAKLLIAMDEVESVFNTRFRADFFAMLRSWHNNRNSPTSEPDWKNLDIALVTSTEPYQFIDDLNQSPFNVGEVVEMIDFTPDETGVLNARYGKPLNSDRLAALYDLLCGHPYLTSRALYLLASGRLSADDLFKIASQDDGPFGDHLRYHLLRLNRVPEQMQAFVQIIRQNQRDWLKDEQLIYRLQAAGLVRTGRTSVLPRCRLYAEYFGRHFGV